MAFTNIRDVGSCAKCFFGGNMEDERLEKLSDLVRRGAPIGFGEFLEVIAYQDGKKLHRPTTAWRSLCKWLKRHFAMQYVV